MAGNEKARHSEGSSGPSANTNIGTLILLEILFDNCADTIEYLVERAYAIHRLILTLSRVVVGNNCGLLVVDLDTVADHLFVSVVGTTAALAAQQDALYQLFGGNLHKDHHVDFQVALSENLVERLSLQGSAGEAVEDVAVGVAMAIDVIGHDVDHELIGSQLATRDVSLHTLAKFGLGVDFATNNRTCRDVIHVIFLDQFLGLSSFTAPGCAEQYDIQHIF